jgi:NADH-quinone oxidoreductase subunit G/[NiFe] hydrogenase diaphorase moiety small subunit
MNTNTSQGLPRGKSGDTDATDRPALVDITIDERPVSVPSGTTILEAARSIGARIPTLCHHDDLCAAGACRLCLVEVKGQRTLQAACTFPITQPVEVTTSSRRIRKARQHILDLLLSEHHGECHTCPRNTTCELQALAKEHGVDTPRFGRPAGPAPRPDDSGFAIVRDPGKCILCRRCTRTCGGLQDVGALGVAGRGEHTRVSTYLEKPLADVVCINCGQCVNRCPTGALRVNNSTDEVWEAIDDPDKHVIIQTAPSPRAAIGEEFGLAPGTSVTWRLNTALRRCGFDKVFDTNFSADLTIMEEGAELLARLHRRLALGDPEAALPLFTSCSPGWIKYLEHFHPEYLPNLSTCKSPQQMFGALIKTWYAQSRGIDPAKVVSVALMPCTAKKFECRRPEMRASGHHDVDYALTTRELAQMIREAGIRLPEMPASDFDDPFGSASGSGVIFGATGGVMEAALRSVIEFATGRKVEDFHAHADIIPLRGFEGCRYAEVALPERLGPVPALLGHLLPDFDWLAGATLKVGVAHGTANARKVLEDIRAGGPFSQCHFIEFMACPGGCLGGGGQPRPTNEAIRTARAKAIYGEDEACGPAGRPRKSHENRAVLDLYAAFLEGGPGGAVSHRLLHTHYTPRGKFIG